MLKLVVSFFLIFCYQLSFAKIVITGNLCGKRASLASNAEAYYDLNSAFPVKRYEVGPFFICNLQYAKDTSQSDRKLDINYYRFIIADGELKRCSKSGNYYSYKLFINTVNASTNINGKKFAYIRINGKIIFPDNKTYHLIEGRFKKIKGKSQPTLENTFKSKYRYYRFTALDKSFPNMMLTRLSNFPVKIEIDI